MSAQSWLLGGGYPWRTLDPRRDPVGPEGAVVANDRDGLTLAPLPNVVWGLDAADDGLGRLTLPRGVAVWGDVVLTLSSAGDRVLRYDPVRVVSSPLAEIGLDGLAPPLPPGAHREPRRFRRAANIALYQSWLYVADPETQRVQVFDLETLALLRIHAVDDPVDVAAGTDGVYWLDRARGRVYTDRPGLASPRLP